MEIIGTFEAINTGSYSKYVTNGVNNVKKSGKYDLYFEFRGGKPYNSNGTLFNLAGWELVTESMNPASSYSENNDISFDDCIGGRQFLYDIDIGDYVIYKDIDFINAIGIYISLPALYNEIIYIYIDGPKTSNRVTLGNYEC